MAGTMNLGNVVAYLKFDTKQFTGPMASARASMHKFGTDMAQLGRSMTYRLTIPLVAAATVSAKAFGAFDDAMEKSLAIMGDVSAKMRQEMRDTALDISLNSIKSAKDIADGYFFLASAGFTAAQSLAAIRAVDRFAVAGSFDLATATSLAADAQKTMGLNSLDAAENLKSLQHVMNVLVKANTLANATTEQFAVGLTTQLGPALRQYGISLEEGTAMLAAYANQGIKAQEAGSMGGRMLLRT